MAIVKIPVLVSTGTKAGAAAKNRILKTGEWGYETDAYGLKIGRGLPWNDTPYLFDGGSSLIGNLASLKTSVKDKLVHAINELFDLKADKTEVQTLSTTVNTLGQTVGSQGENLNSLGQTVNGYTNRIFNAEQALNTLQQLVNGTDTSLNSILQIQAYIKANRSSIEGLITGKINTSAISDVLTETASGKVLDARQGKVLKDLTNTLATNIQTLRDDLNRITQQAGLGGYLVLPFVAGSPEYPTEYVSELTLVIKEGNLFRLAQSVPYASTDFEAELEAGIWQPVDADFDSYTLTETFQNADVFPLQRTGKQKFRYTWQGLVNAVKAIFGTGIQTFKPSLAYKVGDTFRDGDIVYEVQTEWDAGTYYLVSSIPTERTKLIANLGRFSIRSATNTGTTSNASLDGNIQHQAYILHPSALAGQVVSFSIYGRIPLGRLYTIYVKYNGISTVRASDSSELGGDLSWPSGIVSGDWVCFEFLAKEEGKLSLTQKYIEGKASSSGTSQSASTGLPASSTLVFSNQAGESHLPLTSATAVTFTLGAGPHVPMTTKRQPVVLTAAAAINFQGPFTFQYHNIGATLAAGTYEFWFTYNEDNTISVSVPGSPASGGTTINSTDDIQNEGTNNLWFTAARVSSAGLLANLWSYIGLASSSATISVKAWLDFLTNKIKLNEEAIALRVKSVSQGGTVYNPDVNGQVSLPTPPSTGMTTVTFTPTLTFSGSKFMTHTQTGAIVLTEAASGHTAHSTLRLVIMANGGNTCNLDDLRTKGWLNENGGEFVNGKKNILSFVYHSATDKFYTITQPR